MSSEHARLEASRAQHERSIEKEGQYASMQRLVEQPAGEGDLFEEGLYLGRVHYHLAVYQYFPDEGERPVPANLEVEGRVTALEDLDLAALHATGVEFALRLADGRWLDFRILEGNGSVRSTGRGLHMRP